MAKKPLYIDCIAGSQLRDTQGEMLSIEGADISDLQEGKGRWNDNHGKGFFNSIGRITEAKKIFKSDDCENERHKYYWEKVKSPFIYAAGYLYDDEDHPNARAAAAILRNIHKSDVPLKLKASVEGGVLARDKSDPSLLAKTKIHSVALTFTPANNATLVEPISMDKSVDEKSDMELIKSVMHLAQTNIPSFRHITRDASASKVVNNIEKIFKLMKDGDTSMGIPSKQDIIEYSLEAKIQNNIEKIYKAIANLTEETLEKGKKELLNMYRPEHLELGRQHVEWASKLPKNNWKEWVVKNHANDPSSFTHEHKQAIDHFAGINDALVRNTDLSPKDSLEEGLNKLKKNEKAYIDKYNQDKHYVKPEGAKKIINTKPNRGWFDIGKSYCEHEGSAMGHCGNVEGQDRTSDKILSLRDEIKIGNNTLHQPNLTFIENNGWLGETKGKGNQKPNNRYHDDIVQLLKNPRIKGIAGGGYQPENNFQFKDLSLKHQQEVLNANPGLITDLDSNDNIGRALGKGLPTHLLEHVADMPDLDPKHHELLVNYGNSSVRHIMAERSDLDPKCHEQLVNDDEAIVRGRIATNPNLSPKYHEQLVNDDEAYVRDNIARNPNLSPKYHERLVNDDEDHVRYGIATNPNLDSKYHEQLVNDDKAGVRGGIARNPNLDPKYHEQLVNDDEAGVRHDIATNPNLDSKYHEQLVNDDKAIVRDSIARNPNLSPKYHERLVNDDEAHVRGNIARNPNLDSKYHERLVNDDEAGVRDSIARNPNLSPKYHERLVNDDEAIVRGGIARNPNLDSKHHEQLVNDDEAYVRSGIARNPNLDPKYHEQLVMDDDPHVRYDIATNPNLDSKYHEQLANDSNPDVRYAIATNPAYKYNKERLASSIKQINTLQKGIVRHILHAEGKSIILNSKHSTTQDFLENKIKSNVRTINDLVKQIVENECEENTEKSIKSAITGAAMLGAASLSGDTPKIGSFAAPSNKITVQSKPIDRSTLMKRHIDHFKKFSRFNPILEAIGHKESTQGKYFDQHKTVTDPTSMHLGMTAGGTYAIMPITLQDTFRVSKKIREKYPKIANLVQDVKTNHKKITEALNQNPWLGFDATITMMNHNGKQLKKAGIEPTEDAILFAHNHGLQRTIDTHSKNPNLISRDKYVVTAKKLRDATRQSANVIKALTAGYGGAGTPMSSTGGNVLQSESLEKPLKGLKYITCDDCGKEQIYAKYQVKCRNCNKNWSLAKLQDVFKV